MVSGGFRWFQVGLDGFGWFHVLSITLLTYQVTDDKDFTRFEPHTPQYKKFKNGELTSLIMDQNNNIMTDGPQVTVVLHIHDCKI